MTPHSPSSTRLTAQRTSDILSLLDARARSRRRWAFAFALVLNILVWKAIASLPQAPSQSGSSGTIEWSRVVLDPLPPSGGALKLSKSAFAPKGRASGNVQRALSFVAPQATREPQTRVARRNLSVPNFAPKYRAPQRASSAKQETPQPMRHDPDLETPMPSGQNQPDATSNVRSTASQRATWTTTMPRTSASSTQARTDNTAPRAWQTPSFESATQSAKTSRESGTSSTRSANMTAAPSSGASSSTDLGHRSGADFSTGSRDGSSQDGSSSLSDLERNRGDTRNEGGNFGGRSSSRMSAPDARMRELPDLKPRSEPRPTPRPEPRSTPREESRPIFTPRPQPRETPRPAEERPQPTPETMRNVEKPKRSIEVREAQAAHIVKPRVPKRLRGEKRRLSVGLDVDVDEKGRATPRLRESSGDGELDEEALKAARKTRWKPRAEDGRATKSTQRMRYDVDVKDGAGNDSGDEESDDN